jgi:hypothetical protein
MEETRKLTVEIDLLKEEAERFEAFIEDKCLDRDKYLKRVLIEGIRHFMKEAGKRGWTYSSLG